MTTSLSGIRFFSPKTSPTDWALKKADILSKDGKRCSAFCMTQVGTLSAIPSSLKNLVCVIVKTVVAAFALTICQIPSLKEKTWSWLKEHDLVAKCRGRTLLALALHVYKVVAFLVFSPFICLFVGTFSPTTCKKAHDALLLTHTKKEPKENHELEEEEKPSIDKNPPDVVIPIKEEDDKQKLEIEAKNKLETKNVPKDLPNVDIKKRIKNFEPGKSETNQPKPPEKNKTEVPERKDAKQDVVSKDPKLEAKPQVTIDSKQENPRSLPQPPAKTTESPSVPLQVETEAKQGNDQTAVNHGIFNEDLLNRAQEQDPRASTTPGTTWDPNDLSEKARYSMLPTIPQNQNSTIEQNKIKRPGLKKEQTAEEKRREEEEKIKADNHLKVSLRKRRYADAKTMERNKMRPIGSVLPEGEKPAAIYIPSDK